MSVGLKGAFDGLSHVRAARDAAHKVAQLAPRLTMDSNLPQIGVNDIPPALFKSFFDLLGECEKEGPMDYHKYAQRLWKNTIGKLKLGMPPEGAVFEAFEADLIVGLHRIDMAKIIYPDIAEKAGDIIKALYEKAHVKKVALWSTGDADATGYQHGKIAASNIVNMFLRAALSHDRAKASIREAGSTEYIVHGNKLQALRDDLLKKKTAGQDSVKIAVIEDSLKNLKAVQAMVKEIFGDKGEVVPVWSIYSREGIAARKKDEGQFLNDAKAYNAIESFSAIATEPIVSLLAGAEVYVDFDGVLGNNIDMRNQQAIVTAQALIHAAKKLNVNLSDAL